LTFYEIINLWKAYIRGLIQNVALEVMQFHPVKIRQADGSHPGCREVYGCGGPQATRPHDEYPGLGQFSLPFSSDPRKDHPAGIPMDLFLDFCREKNLKIGECHSLGKKGRILFWPNLFALNAIFLVAK